MKRLFGRGSGLAGYCNGEGLWRTAGPHHGGQGVRLLDAGCSMGASVPGSIESMYV